MMELASHSIFLLTIRYLNLIPNFSSQLMNDAFLPLELVLVVTVVAWVEFGLSAVIKIWSL